jgi:DNA-binding XRE family transcriptional regulator
MDKAIEQFKKLLSGILPQSRIKVEEPENPKGSYWLDVSMGKKLHTLEYRPGKGFGLFRNDASYGEGPTEIYLTAERAVQRLVQVLASVNDSAALSLKEIRELYGYSQVKLAKKIGVKQSALSRFETRNEYKLSTLVSNIKALGGKLEIRARFADSDVPISLPESNK